MKLSEILEFVNFVANKDQLGNSVSAEQFNSLLKGFNAKIFQDEVSAVEVAAKAQGIPMYTALYAASSLKPFRKPATINTDAAGIGALPADYVHYTGIAAQYNGAVRRVDVISENEMIDRRGNFASVQLTVSPACTLYGNTISVYPRDLGHFPNHQIELSYIRYPLTPFLDHCVSKGTGLTVYMPVGSVVRLAGTKANLYDEDNNLLVQDVERAGTTAADLPYTSQTVELEWEPLFHFTFVKLLLVAMGVNMKDEQIRSYQEGNK